MFRFTERGDNHFLRLGHSESSRVNISRVINFWVGDCLRILITLAYYF